MKLFSNRYSNRRILITGHTGFKGSWLSLWLSELGADLCGISLDPDTNPNHYDFLKIEMDDHRVDIRDTDAVYKIIHNFNPEIVFHLAAQPLVRRSYKEPVDNWATNVIGTANILDACRKTESVTSIVAITTDKVYENKEWPWGYREIDRLGGHDPYSASKAACELLIDSYRNSYFSGIDSLLLASARAGNVIGGADWSEDRLVPDLVRSVEGNTPLVIRSPNATRPWQHVLDCLTGYLQLGEKLLQGKLDYAEAWNFGPNELDNRTVLEMLTLMKQFWPELEWNVTSENQPHEANLLYLDNTKSKSILNWKPVWHLEQTIESTADWYRQFLSTRNIISTHQLNKYIKDASKAGVSWIE